LEVRFESGGCVDWLVENGHDGFDVDRTVLVEFLLEMLP
jgi:hypothetical protein